MKFYTTLFAALAMAGCCHSYVAADVLTDALGLIETNSVRLRALGAQRDADTEASRVGVGLANPELEVGYLWGAAGGPDRKDLGLSQEFDMETLSGAKGKVGAAQRGAALTAYAEARREVLLEAKLALIELIACNASEELCRKRLQQADAMAEVAAKLNADGQLSRIEYNKTMLQKAESDNALRMASMARRKAQQAVDALNGGQHLDFPYVSYPPLSLPKDFNSWLDVAVYEDPSMAALRSAVDVSSSEVKLAKSGNLPSFTLGYSGEFIEEGTLNGVSLGISLPLWGNRGAVKAARAKETAARLQQEEGDIALRAELEGLYEEVTALAQLEKAYIDATGAADNEELLKQTLGEGEMNPLDYMQEMQYKIDVAERVFSIRRDMNVAAARLNSYSL